VWQHLDGASDAATMRARAIAATRQLAKRQLTWLRSTPATVLDPQSTALDDIAARFAAALRDGPDSVFPARAGIQP
jgi:tRNA dimethylallyltransferase